MTNKDKFSPTWIILGSFGVASAILLGAYGAHGLEDIFERTPRKERAWGNAVDYQMFHGLALVVLGFSQSTGTRAGLVLASACCMVLAWILFCASIYAWVMGGPISLIKVTPLGGILFFIAWVLLLVYGFLNLKSSKFKA